MGGWLGGMSPAYRDSVQQGILPPKPNMQYSGGQQLEQLRNRQRGGLQGGGFAARGAEIMAQAKKQMEGAQGQPQGQPIVEFQGGIRDLG